MILCMIVPVYDNVPGMIICIIGLGMILCIIVPVPGMILSIKIPGNPDKILCIIVSCMILTLYHSL